MRENPSKDEEKGDEEKSFCFGNPNPKRELFTKLAESRWGRSKGDFPRFGRSERLFPYTSYYYYSKLHSFFQGRFCLHSKRNYLSISILYYYLSCFFSVLTTTYQRGGEEEAPNF